MASRLSTLNNKTLGIIDNGKFNSDVVLQTLRDKLQEMYNLKEVVYFRKSSASHPISDHQAKELANQCDVIISGIGD